MFVRARRPIAALCTALLALDVGCVHIRQEEAATAIQPGAVSAPMEKIVGVTLKDGRDIRFDQKSRPFLRGDSLQAEVGKRPLGIPVSDLQRVWVQSTDKTRTASMVIGVTALVLVVAAAASFASGPPLLFR